MDKCVIARTLIDESADELIEQLNKKVKNIQSAMIEAQQSCKGLDKLGSGNISAPDILAGRPLEQLVALQQYVNRCVEQIQNLQ